MSDGTQAGEFDLTTEPNCGPRALRLMAVSGVEGKAGDFIATELEPWLEIGPISIFTPGRWFRMRYRLGLYDQPSRPVVSYRRDSEEIGWHLLPGPVLGRAEWIGTVPEDATAVWISPVTEPGRFCFAIEEIEPLSTLKVLLLGWAGGRGRLFSAIGTFLLGWRPEALENLHWSIQGAPLTAWPSYRDRLSADVRLDEFERPRRDWSCAPMVRIFAILDKETGTAQIDATISSLLGQIYPRWTLTALGTPAAAEVQGQLKSWLNQDSRLAAGSEKLEFDGDDTDFVAFVEFGDRLVPHAFACFIEASQRAPDALVLYCDEETATVPGGAPLFKPDWCAHLQAATPYVGRLMLTRLGHARRRMPLESRAACESFFVKRILKDLGRKDVRNIRRFLVQTKRSRCERKHSGAPKVPRRMPEPETSVTIVMATRDRAGHLRRTLNGIVAATRYPLLDLVIVDNGSTGPQALALLESAALDPRVTVLRSPGLFNFAALNNLGASHARGDVIIFLNNDMGVIDPDWVRELAGWATEPKVGAVGCKLLYPNGRIQHAGIVVGIGDSAGHFDAGRSAEEPGWLGRNHCVHEISAVTGACMAVERAKFELTGGFDAIHLPVEFGDIDLCLRLDELGFVTLWTPFARLVHFESASRGKATFRRLNVHAAERAYFRQRWAKRLRDDPCYHPGLSLVRLSAALG
ncbi:MAG: glycosyltransferase [Beijerinckiaceae bacterium]|nr:glycosyltransferase [Beijerinckiaceae bacterium]MCI0736207.1 glycosyltransferase [Beijerinckiaceae bacterium]